MSHLHTSDEGPAIVSKLYIVNLFACKFFLAEWSTSHIDDVKVMCSKLTRIKKKVRFSLLTSLRRLQMQSDI